MNPVLHTHGVRFGMQTAGKALDDLPHAHRLEPRAGGHALPLAFALCLLVCLLVFVGWLLVG